MGVRSVEGAEVLNEDLCLRKALKRCCRLFGLLYLVCTVYGEEYT